MTTVDLRQHYNAQLGLVGIGTIETAHVESADLDHEQMSSSQLDRVTRGARKQDVRGKIGLAAVRPDNAYLELTPGLTKLSPAALRDLASLAGSFTKLVQSTESKPTPELENKYSGFFDTYVLSGEVKIDNIMHYLQREAAIDKSKDLQSWAEKIKIFKEMREKARQEWARAREVLSKVGGMPDTTVLEEPFTINGEEFGAPSGPLSTEGGALVDIDGDGITDFIMPPELYDKHGVADAIKELNEIAVVTTTTVTPELTTEVGTVLVLGPTIDPYAVYTRCKGNHAPSPSNLANAPHLKLAIYSILQENKKISADELARRLEAEYGIKATVTTIK
ncbi:MAG: hypothetical protein V3T05_07180, partial [Myxococcota bacterium]